METATVVVAPAPVAITQPPQHKLMELKLSFAPVATRKAKPTKKKLTGGCGGYVLEDVPHLTDYLPELKVSLKLIHLKDCLVNLPDCFCSCSYSCSSCAELPESPARPPCLLCCQVSVSPCVLSFSILAENNKSGLLNRVALTAQAVLREAG
jgi:hypothetical protein